MQAHELNLRHLAAVAAVSATGSISGAARIIHRTQPAITQGIAKLERQLGIALFVRRPNGVEITPAGAILADRVTAVLRLIGTPRATSAQIRAYLAVVQHGTYASAGLAVGLSEASLHRAVSDLSIAYGGRLLDRRGRGLMLTRKGKDVARLLNLALKEIESAIVDLAALAGREAGRITIGAMPLARARLLPDAIIAFHKEHPGTDLSVVEGSHAELIGPLRDGRIDFMIGALREEPQADLTSIALLRDVPHIVGRAGHPLCKRASPPTADDLLAYPWLVPPHGTPLRTLWEWMFEMLGADPPHVAIECGSAMTVRQLLVASDHLTLFSTDQIAVELEAGWLATLGVAPGDLSRLVGATMRADWRPTRRQQRFLEHLLATARNLESIIRKI